MGLVMNTNDVSNYLNEKLLVKSGEPKKFTNGDQEFVEIIKYPQQLSFEEGATIYLIRKPMWDFAKECGPKGAMTYDKIVEKLEGIAEDDARAIADDFAIFYGNYIIIPENCTLILTKNPIKSLSELEIPVAPPIEEETVE